MSVPAGLRVERLLTASARLLDLDLCIHDRQQELSLPPRRQLHANPSCLAVKARCQAECAAFDGVEVHRAVAGLPDGRLHVCPFGRLEAALPIVKQGLLVGVLFAGLCEVPRLATKVNASRGAPASAARKSLEARRPVLRALVSDIERLLGEPRAPEDRRYRIMSFVHTSLRGDLSLSGLARNLGLAVSRAGHVVRELFGKTYPALVRSVRLREAARYLTMSDHSITEIALLVGYDDPNYLSRQFAVEYGVSPRAYRRLHGASFVP
jgi:AraC-like DNA-binding protein